MKIRLLFLLFGGLAQFSVGLFAQSPQRPKVEELVAAIKSDDPWKVKDLVSRSVDVNAADKAGMTPLHYAAHRGSVAVAEILLSAGADLRGKDGIGSTPLHSAALDGRLSMALYLLAKGADPNARDDAGMTPLHYASAMGNAVILKVLTDVGGDPESKDLKGRRPAELAALSEKKPAAKKPPAEPAPPTQATIVVNDENMGGFRPPDISVQLVKEPPGKGSGSSSSGSESRILEMEARLKEMRKRKRDLDATLGGLRDQCEKAKSAASSSEDTAPDSTVIPGSYSRTKEAERRDAAQRECARYQDAQRQVQNMEMEIARMEKSIAEMRTAGAK